MFKFVIQFVILIVMTVHVNCQYPSQERIDSGVKGGRVTAPGVKGRLQPESGTKNRVVVRTVPAAQPTYRGAPARQPEYPGNPFNPSYPSGPAPPRPEYQRSIGGVKGARIREAESSSEIETRTETRTETKFQPILNPIRKQNRRTINPVVTRGRQGTKTRQSPGAYATMTRASNARKAANSKSELFETVCVEPKIIGPCRARIERYAYNPSTELCEQFWFGGCSGNANNFERGDDCVRTCEAKGISRLPIKRMTNSEQCSLELDAGPCTGDLIRFGFNPATRKCEEFVFGGCGGNANRFGFAEECVNFCGAGGVVTLIVDDVIDGGFGEEREVYLERLQKGGRQSDVKGGQQFGGQVKY